MIKLITQAYTNVWILKCQSSFNKAHLLVTGSGKRYDSLTRKDIYLFHACLSLGLTKQPHLKLI